MYATPSHDGAVVVTFRVGPSANTPADAMNAAVRTVIDLSYQSFGRRSLDLIRVGEVWAEQTRKGDHHANDTVHVAMSMPDHLRRRWYGLGAVNPQFEVGTENAIPADARHWDSADIDHIRLNRIDVIDRIIEAEAKPSGLHLVVGVVMIATGFLSLVLGSVAGAATLAVCGTAMLAAGLLEPDVDGTPTHLGALHARRHRLTILIGVANTAGLFLPRLLDHLPIWNAIPDVVAGLLPIAMIAGVAAAVARSSVTHLSRLNRQLDAAGAFLVPATDDVRSVGRSMDALLAICAVLPEQDRLTAAAAADRCRLAAGYSAEGPATGAFDRSIETLDKVLASHRRASAYAVGDEAIPLARRVHEALVAAGDEAETLRVTLLASETDSLDTLGRYLESRRRHDALSPVG